MPALHYPGTPGTMIYGGRASIVVPAPGGVITTLTLSNTSGTEQAAGFVSPMFGLPIKQGDVPAGEYPIFETTGGTACPATIWGVTSWPDGSMKFCGAMIRVPAAVAGSGTLTINVKGGGSAPTASARAVADLAAADISAELEGVTNLTGTWTASLNTAITDADDIVLIGDGPAGKVWRIGGPFKQGGTAHGQLHAWHYVAALQNAAGALAGIRYLGRVTQPWTDVATPAPTRRVFTASLKSGATTLRSLQGHDTTATLGASIGLPHYASIFTAGTDGKWDYVQGGGSQAADCTVRVVYDKTEFIGTRMVPPYDTSVTPTPTASVDYYPMGRAALAQYGINTTGPSNFIGVIPQWCATHLLTQSAADERAVRASGLACAGFRVFARRSSTRQIVPVVDVQASYAGLGTIDTGARLRDGTYTNIASPASNTSVWSGESDSSHRPSAFYYPYLMTGEPQFLDLQIEYAAQIIMSTAPGTYVRNTTLPITSLRSGAWAGERNTTVAGTTYKGAGHMFLGGGARQSAWAVRDIAQAVAVIPDAEPTGVKAYLSDVLTSNIAAVNALNSAMPQSWRDSGLFATAQNTYDAVNFDANYESPWMNMYLSMVMCHVSQVTAAAGAVTLRQHFGRFISATAAAMDVAHLASYRWKQWNGNTLITSTDDLTFMLSPSVVFDTATDRATVSGTAGTWAPTNGDKIAFSTNLDADKPFAEAANEVNLYMVGASGQTFQLASTPGGAAIDVTTGATITSCFVQLQNASPLRTFENGGTYYSKLLYEACRFHEAVGDTFVAPARAEQDGNLAALGITFTADPRSALAAIYPG